MNLFERAFSIVVTKYDGAFWDNLIGFLPIFCQAFKTFKDNVTMRRTICDYAMVAVHLFVLIYSIHLLVRGGRPVQASVSHIVL